MADSYADSELLNVSSR